MISAGQTADREVIPQATKLNPALFDTIYVRLLNEAKSRTAVEAALSALDVYLADRTASLFAPVFTYLRDAGEARSCSEIENYFKRHFDIGEVATACEYLADQRLITKVSLPARLTRKSNVAVQELAFVYLRSADDEWTP